jgi:hypothetical protein
MQKLITGPLALGLYAAATRSRSSYKLTCGPITLGCSRDGALGTSAGITIRTWLHTILARAGLRRLFSLIDVEVTKLWKEGSSGLNSISPRALRRADQGTHTQNMLKADVSSDTNEACFQRQERLLHLESRTDLEASAEYTEQGFGR